MYDSPCSKGRTPAVLGGSPAFESPLHVGRPNVGNPENLLARIQGILDRKWFTNNGPLVQEFEQLVAERLGVRNCVATSSGTSALEISIRALDLRGEVIVPSFTFVATVHALQWQGIHPVFCDIDPRTHNVDPARIEELVTPRTTGILGVHVWGRPCDVDGLKAVSRRFGLPLLFDASHAFDCTYKGLPVGRFGNAEVFSFHATKFVHSGEGGAVTTDDDELADRMRLIRNFGFAGNDLVVSIGINAKMNEISAAMGLTSLEQIDHFKQANRERMTAYRELTSGLPGLTTVSVDGEDRHNCQYVVIDVDPKQCPLSRDDLLSALRAENVLARRYFYPGCHRMEPYCMMMPAVGRRLPNTESLCQRVMQLPTGTNVSLRDVEMVVACIRNAVAHASAIRNVLAHKSIVKNGEFQYVRQMPSRMRNC